MKMKKINLKAKIFVLLLSLFSIAARAHDVPASKLWLDIGTYAVDAEIVLPLSELREAIGLPVDATAAELATQHASHVKTYIDKHIAIATPDGKFYIKKNTLLEASHTNDGDVIVARVHFQAPNNASTTQFVLHDDAIVAEIVTHNIFVFVRRDFRNGLFVNTSDNGVVDEQSTMIGVMHYQQKKLTVDGSSGSWLQGFKKVFQLGMQHIAEGIDHVLFLLVLLVAAPLRVRNQRWSGVAPVKTSVWKILKTVSGFTVGHSLTLILGAVGVFTFPSQIIEVLIALSILISAVHAVRPFFANREHYIAALFGLVHGMAFANSLTGFHYDTVALTLAVLGFNLGIEFMQLIIVAAVLPSLLLMSTTRYYRYPRIALAVFIGVLAVAWILERAFTIENPLTIVSNMLLAHGVFALIIIAVLAIIFYAVEMMEVVMLNRSSRLNLQDRFN